MDEASFWFALWNHELTIADMQGKESIGIKPLKAKDTIFYMCAPCRNRFIITDAWHEYDGSRLILDAGCLIGNYAVASTNEVIDMSTLDNLYKGDYTIPWMKVIGHEIDNIYGYYDINNGVFYILYARDANGTIDMRQVDIRWVKWVYDNRGWSDVLIDVVIKEVSIQDLPPVSSFEPNPLRGGEEDMKAVATLAEFLEIGEHDIEVVLWNGNADYYTPKGYYTLIHEDDIEEKAEEYAENLCDDIGFDNDNGFRDIIMSNIDSSNMEDWVEEDQRGYVEDIVSETYHTEYANRLIDECVEADIISDEDLDDDGFCTTKSTDELIDAYTEYLMDRIKQEYNGEYIDWHVDTFGDIKAVKYFLQHGFCSIDYKGVADDLTRMDGYGSMFAGWDGVENYQDGYYIFKQDDVDRRSVEFLESINI